MVNLARSLTAVMFFLASGCSEQVRTSDEKARVSASQLNTPDASAINLAMVESDLRSRMDAIWPFTTSSAKQGGRTKRVQAYNGIPISMTMNLASAATDWSYLEATFLKDPDLPPTDAELVLAQFADDLRWAGLPDAITLQSENDTDIAEWRWERESTDGEHIRRIQFRLKAETGE